MENAVPLEIERKYLIRLPDEGLLDALAFRRDWIEQTYLKNDAGETERVRLRRAPGGAPVYTHTVKRRRSALTREEYEEEIGVAEYAALLERADPGLRVIQKTRWCVSFAGQTLEHSDVPMVYLLRNVVLIRQYRFRLAGVTQANQLDLRKIFRKPPLKPSG